MSIMAPRSRPQFLHSFLHPFLYSGRFGLIALLLAGSGCTQAPVQVVLNGQNTYGPNGVIKAPAPASYAANLYRSPSATPPFHDVSREAGLAPASNSTYQTASVQPIGISDLPPPPFSIGASQEAPKAKEESKAAEQHVRPVNLWTKEPHFADSGIELRPRGILSQSVKTAPSVSYMWPVSSKKIVTSFGPKAGGRVSDGLGIASSEGEPVWASAAGEVVFVGDELKGYGNMVLIKHPDGKTTTYAHLSRAAIDKYDRVKQGDIIGYVGTTGNVRTPQLYFAINEGKTALDPEKYLSHDVAGL